MAAVLARPRQEPYHVPSRPVQQAYGSLSQRPAREKKRSSCSTSISKLEKCKTQAQQRRLVQKGLMDELAGLLPFPKEVTGQMDTKTVLRLVICYLRVKSLVNERGETTSPGAESANAEWPMVAMESSCQQQSMVAWNPAMIWNGRGTGREDVFSFGILQDLMTEALNGFLMVISCDGTILYLSDTVFTHTGLFQSEHIGKSVYSLVHDDDHSEVREALAEAEGAALSSGVAQCSFFCRMKSKKKNTHLKAPGYKLVYITGHCKVHTSETYVACTVHIVSAPSILEIRAEGNAFSTRHNMEMKIIFYDERLQDVLGYTKKDLLGRTIFALHHHEDLSVTEACSHRVREKGESVTGYYRLMTNYGSYVWMQSRATMIVDRRTGKPSQLLCMHYIVEKSRGEESLTLRNMLTNNPSQSGSITTDPIPVPRPDGQHVNPLAHTTEEPPQRTLTSDLPPSSVVTPLSVSMTTDHFASSTVTSGTITASTLYGTSVPASLPVTQQASPSVCDVTRCAAMTTVEQCVTRQLEAEGVAGQSEVDPAGLFDAIELLSSSCDSQGDVPLINIPPSTSLFPHSHSVAPPPMMFGSDRLQQQLCPPFSHSSSPSSSPSSSFIGDHASTIPTPFSTPVVSPFWQETSPQSIPDNSILGTGSNATGPQFIPSHSILGSNVPSPQSIPSHSILGSNVTSHQSIPSHSILGSNVSSPQSIPSHSILGSNAASPQSIPSHTHTPEPATLDEILQDLLGTTSDHAPSSSVAKSDTAASLSPDSGCTDLESYLASLMSQASPSYTPVCTPTSSCVVPSPSLEYSGSIRIPHCDPTPSVTVGAIKTSETLRGLLTLPQVHILSK